MPETSTEPKTNSKEPPFKQPFLWIRFHSEDVEEWFVDVGGRIDDFINGYTTVMNRWRSIPYQKQKERGVPPITQHEVVNWMSQATPRMTELMDQLARAGKRVAAIRGYYGGGGPSHMLAGDVLFKRVVLKPLAPEPIGEDITNLLPEIHRAWSETHT